MGRPLGPGGRARDGGPGGRGRTRAACAGAQRRDRQPGSDRGAFAGAVRPRDGRERGGAAVPDTGPAGAAPGGRPRGQDRDRELRLGALLRRQGRRRLPLPDVEGGRQHAHAQPRRRAGWRTGSSSTPCIPDGCAPTWADRVRPFRRPRLRRRPSTWRACRMAVPAGGCGRSSGRSTGSVDSLAWAADYPTAATRSADSSHARARCAVLSSAKRVATRTTSAPNVRSCSSTLSSVSRPSESKTRYAEATGTT